MKTDNGKGIKQDISKDVENKEDNGGGGKENKNMWIYIDIQIVRLKKEKQADIYRYIDRQLD